MAPIVSGRSALAGLGSPSAIGANRGNEPLARQLDHGSETRG